MKTAIITCLLFLFIPVTNAPVDFKTAQLKHTRVSQAYKDKGSCIEALLKDHNIKKPQLFIRIFKHEQLLEIWAKERHQQQYQEITSFPFCTTVGELGPKRQRGDYQIPEGFYEIDRFNPESNFHLSLGINYPNDSDRTLSNARFLGGDIFIHGNCMTIGCIPITDDWIEELYILAVEARNAGQETIPTHIFPTKLDANGYEYLTLTTRDNTHHAFWKNLQEGYLYFENQHQLPEVSISETGRYIFE